MNNDGWKSPAAFEGWLPRAQAGDEEAFARIWRAFQPALLRYLRVLAGPAGDDLAADVWVQVVRTLDRFEGDERGFRAWLHTMGRHCYFDSLRRAKRRPELLSGEPVEQAADEDPLRLTEVGLSTDAALRLIARLPADQAEAVTLRVVADLDVARVAAIMGRQPGTVRVLTHRGLRRLAALLEPLTRTELAQDLL
jgi:RNA polymerase sigma-70 factor (ECF subfamily)